MTNDTADDPLVDRASRLFEYLLRVQQLTNRPIRHVDAYRDQGGAVLWLHQFPQHDAVTVTTPDGDVEPDAPLFTLDRVPRLSLIHI